VNPAISIVGVEPLMYPSFTARMAGLPAKVGGQTVAEGIAVKTVGELTFAAAAPLIDEVLLVDEPFFEQGRGALRHGREDGGRGRGRRIPGRAAGLSGEVPRQEDRSRHHRR
jgi:hypothetical protein